MKKQEWKLEVQKLLYEGDALADNIGHVTDELNTDAWDGLFENGLTPKEAIEHADEEWTDEN